MKMINYPKLEHHKYLHFNLLEKLNVAKHSNTSFELFLEFVVDWFTQHTTIEDIQIHKYCKENNIDINFKFNIFNE